MQLRPYQERAIETLWSALRLEREVLCVLPTGGGKTLIMAELIARAVRLDATVRIVILAQKVDLVSQLVERIGHVVPREKIQRVAATLGDDVRVRPDAQVIVGTVQSLVRVKSELSTARLLVIDEVHNADLDDDTAQYAQVAHAGMKVLGFTATPFTATGPIYGPKKAFKRVHFRRTLSQMIEDGYLVRPVLKRGGDEVFDVTGLKTRYGEYLKKDVERLTADEKKVRRQIVDALSRSAGRRKFVWFCSSITHAEMVARVLCELGEDAVTLHSKLRGGTRDKNKSSFTDYEHVRHLTFVDVVSEGFDFPPIDCVVFMRPTRSPIRYVQVAGRGLRLSRGKEDCLVLDYGRVVENLGPLDAPHTGAPSAKRSNTETVSDPPAMKFCEKCYEYCHAVVTVCPACNHEFPVRQVSKNLSHYAATEGMLIGSSGKTLIREERVTHTELSYHRSKSGNECVVVHYYTPSLVYPKISEYFAWGIVPAYKRMQKRLIDMQVELKGTPQEQATQVIKQAPLRVRFLLEKYPRVDQLVFTDAEGSTTQK